MTHSLHRLHRAYTAALPTAGTRQLEDGPTVEELQLEATLALQLEPVFVGLYRYPLSDGGLAELPAEEAAALAWLLSRLSEPDATRQLERLLNRYSVDAFDVGGNLALEQMGVTGTFRLRDRDLLDALAAFVAVALIATDGQLSLTRTTARDLARWTSQLRQDTDLTDADIANALGERVRARALSRSAATAQTESVRFSRQGMATTYDRNGLNQVIHRTAPELTATGPCTICAPREGLVYNVISGVVVGDDLPLHVGCVLPGNKVVAPGRIEAATKSFYDGPCIEVATSDGRKLSVTPNHPILTPDGWVAAKFLREGMDVIGAANPERLGDAINPDNKHVPTPIEELWHSLHMSPSMTTVSVPLSSEDFHGDGRLMDGNIDIVLPNSLLGRDRISAVAEHSGKHSLSVGDMGSVSLAGDGPLNHRLFGRGVVAHGLMSSRDLGSSFLFGQRIPPKLMPVGVSSHVHPMLPKAVGKCLARHSEVGSQFVGGLTGPVSGSNFLNGQLHRRAITPSRAVLMDPHLFESSRDGLGADPPITSELVDRFPSLITTNEIIKVREFNFFGHVYDLQVNPYHVYVTEGIITHNCVCYHQPAIDGEPLSETDWTPEEGSLWTGG